MSKADPRKHQEGVTLNPGEAAEFEGIFPQDHQNLHVRLSWNCGHCHQPIQRTFPPQNTRITGQCDNCGIEYDLLISVNPPQPPPV